MQNPMVGRVTSGYNLNRRINGQPSPHEGLDIAPTVAGTVGVPVYAAFGGVVEVAVSGRRPGQPANQGPVIAPYRSGNGVAVRNDDRYLQRYNHMTPVVTKGQRVAKGQLLGHIDRSGIQTGPHLHFETCNPDGTTFDPMRLFNHYGITPGVGAPAARPDPNPPGFVESIQRRLTAMGFYTGRIDDDPGPMTDAAIAAFQRTWGLLPDTIWGPVTDTKAKQVEALRDNPRLLIDGHEGQLTVAAHQWQLRAAGHYTGWIDGARGNLMVKGEQAYLKACGYYTGLIDGDFGGMSVRAEQEWLADGGYYKGRVDGDRGELTIRGLQSALNAGYAKQLRKKPAPAPEPRPQPVPPPVPKPQPQPTPAPEPEPAPQPAPERPDPKDFPTAAEYARAVADELYRRLKE